MRRCYLFKRDGSTPYPDGRMVAIYQDIGRGEGLWIVEVTDAEHALNLSKGIIQITNDAARIRVAEYFPRRKVMSLNPETGEEEEEEVGPEDISVYL